MEHIRWQEHHGNAPGYEDRPTTGPWKVGRNSDGNLAIFTDLSSVRTLVAGFKSGTVTEADARVMAASRELLDAAQSALLVLQYFDGEHSRLAEQLGAAINKATRK